MPNLPLQERDFARILLIKPSALGDVVHTIPVLAKLRRRYPAATIDWLITPENAEVVRCHPALTDVLHFNRRGWSGGKLNAAAGVFRLISEIRSRRYDLVIDLHGQLRSAAFALASGASTRIGFDRPVRRTPTRSAEFELRNVPRRGWAGAREGSWLAYTHRIPIPTLDVHAIDRYLWVGQMLGFDDAPPDLAVHLPKAAGQRIELLLKEAGADSGPLALLVPGTMWETKHWTPDGFAAVGRRLTERGFQVALAGGPGDRGCCRQIAAACPGAVDFAGQTTTGELAALIQCADVCVTNDSGSMHLAVALNRPVVSVFGPTNPVHIGPYGRPEAVVRVDLACSPCNYRKLSQCVQGHACMRDLSPEMVLARVEAVLERPKALSAA